MWKRLFFIAAFCLIACANFYGQDTIAGADFRRTSREIRELSPETPTRVLQKDKEKIKASYSIIEKEFDKQGFSGKETAKAILSGWQKVRNDSPLQSFRSINSESFVDFMTVEFLADNGRVEFISTPDKATVSVDGENIGTAKMAMWYPVNKTLMVICIKEGFQTTQTSCSVVAGRSTCPCEMQALPPK